MSIDPNENEVVIARFTAQLAKVTDAESAIAAMPAPTVPDGGRAEQYVKPVVTHAASLRDRARLLAPGLVGTGAAAALVFGVAPVPLTGPLLAYAVSWAGYGWWTTAGRPGPLDSAVLIGRAVVAVAHWIAVVVGAGWHLAARGGRAVVGITKAAGSRPAESAGGAA
ncbi:hypothetical protein ACW9HH_36500 [Nocardia gipuzkoensis]